MNFLDLERPVITGPTIVAAREQISSDLHGEVVLLNLKNGVYYGLNEVGAQIWNLIQEPKTVSEVRDALLQIYEVESHRCEQELLAILQKLADEQLIEVKDVATS
jgi:hypothetical protein